MQAIRPLSLGGRITRVYIQDFDKGEAREIDFTKSPKPSDKKKEAPKPSDGFFARFKKLMIRRSHKI